MPSWLRVALGIVILDQCTKVAANHMLNQFTPKVIVPNHLNFSLSYSEDAVFNYLSTGEGWQRWALVMISFLSIALIFYAKKFLKPHQKTSLFALSLLLGGAIGNLIDRLYVGKAIDFIQLQLSNSLYWPSFNLADAAILLGVAILIADGIYSGNDRARKD